VPTAAQRAGNFSSSRAIIDPANGQPFTGNIIPSARFDPTALNILNRFIPLANRPNNIYQGQVLTPYNTDEYLIELDHLVTETQRFTVSYYTTAGNNAVLPADGTLPWSLQAYTWRQHNANYTWTATPNLVNQARVSYTRYFGGRTNLPAISLHDLGSAFTVQGPPALPQVSVSG
jgi:hypothetical protein